MIRRFLKNTNAATAIEYGLIIAVMSLVIVAGIGATGNSMMDMFSNQDRSLQEAFQQY